MKWSGRSAVEQILRRNSHAEVAAAVSKCHSFLTSRENTCSRAEVWTARKPHSVWGDQLCSATLA